MYVHAHVCVRVCTRVYVCTYTCVRAYAHTHTHSEILLSHKKNETMLLAAPCEDLEMITPSEVRQRDMEHDSIYMQNLKRRR